MSAFREVFGVPAGHSLRSVTSRSGADAKGSPGPWEHEEYDGAGKLVAVYESWPREDGGIAFVKYSPNGWVLSISGQCPRRAPRKARTTRPDETSRHGGKVGLFR